MDVTEVLDTAVGYLGLEDLCFSKNCAAALSDSRALKLLRAINLVNSEVASEYFPLLKEETVESTDGIIEYIAFSERVLDVVTVKSQDGCCVRYKLFPSYLKTKEGGSYTVTYQYLPPKLEFSSLLPYDVKISPRLIALGVSSEYCLLSGMYEEGVMFDKKYREALRMALLTKGERTVKARGW